MEINSKLIAIGCTAVLFAATAFAMAPGSHEQLEAFDLDHNGLFSPAEIDSAGAQIFARADTNRDGRLTPEEITALHGGTGHHGAGHHDAGMSEGDSDADGAMTRTEFVAHLRGHVGQADANHDGQLSMDEMEAMHRRHEPGSERR
jgi:hypothetical protein